jgi:hypothetical protein
MKSHEKTRDAASEAVKALRRALGKTQQAFAVEDLKSAVTTAARYETSHPPRGDVLLRLAEISENAIPKHKASQTQLIRLRNAFRFMYVDDVLSKIGFQLALVPKKKTEPPKAYLLMKFEGPQQVLWADSFHRLFAAARSVTNPECKETALLALNSLREASRACTIDPIEDMPIAYTLQGESNEK